MKKYLFTFFAFAILYPVVAQEAKTSSYSLQQAIEYSLKNSPNILNAELDKLNSVYKKNEILGLGLPQINGSIDIKDYLKIPTSLLPAQIFGGAAGSYLPVKFGTKYNATAGISASQLLFSADYLFGLKASEQFVGLYEINVKRTKAELVSQVSKAYYMVLVNTERLKIYDANISRLKKVTDDLTAYNKQGLTEIIDVETRQVQLNNLMNEKMKMEKLIDLTKTALKFQMGLKLSDDIELTDKLEGNEEQNQELSLSALNVKSRPDLQVFQAQQVLLDLDVKRLKYGYLPTLAAYGSFQYNAQRTSFNLLQFDNNDVNKKWFPISLIGLTLNMNLFDGLQRHYKIQQAKIASQKGLNTLKNLEMASELEANSAVVGYNNALLSLKIQKKNMELAQHILDVNTKKFDQGVGNNFEVVNSEAALKEAQTNYFNAIYDMLVSKIDYQKATGTLVK